MSFRTEDFKRTTRKSKGNCPASLYPHRVDAKKEHARLDRLVLHFDAACGRRRGDMDGAALVDFIGDPRLARGLVATLGQWYRWRTLTVSDLLGRERAQALASAGIKTAMDARAHTYARVNQCHSGFTTEENRASVFALLGEPFGCDAAEWDDLIALDSEASQVLTRTGGVPTPTELAACYNFHSADTALKKAAAASVTGLSLDKAATADLRAYARIIGTTVHVSQGGDTVTLDGGGRMGRVLSHVLHRWGTRATAGHVDTTVAGRAFRLALSVDVLRALGSPLTATANADAPLSKRQAAADLLHVNLLKLRAQGSASGWGFRRLPEAAARGGRVLLPDFRLVRGEQSVWVVFGDTPLSAWDVPVVHVPLTRKGVEAADVLARATDALDGLFASSAGELPLPVPSGVREMCARAALHGLVRVADVQRALHVPDETRLTEWVARTGDGRVRYVVGVGIVARDLEDALARAA